MGDEEKLGPNPKGFRDLFWCWVIREPVLMTCVTLENVTHPGCAACGWTDLDSSWAKDTSPRFSEGFLAHHTFIGHVLKPPHPPADKELAQKAETR